MNDEPWYGAKCIFLHTALKGRAAHVYEERVVLIRAESFDEAIRKAEEEAEEYARDVEDCSYTGFLDLFHIYDEQIADRMEVYSLMRDSDLDVEQYLDHFYDTGDERTGKQE